MSVIRSFNGILEASSGEYLLTKFGYANGGTIVFLRAVHVTVTALIVGLAALNVIDPSRTGGFSWDELRTQLVDSASWLGAVFGGSYAALYTRFSSQWTYLAGMYNQIKAAQVKGDADKRIIAQWRAAYVEDCDDLHLLRKPMFAATVDGLLNGADEEALAVQTAFDAYSPGSSERRKRIAKAARVAVEEYVQRGANRPKR